MVSIGSSLRCGMKVPDGFDLKTYGSQLSAERVARGLSREELSANLFLPTGMLRALEEGDHNNLPEMVYAVSMYRKVATSLGVDPAPMAEKLKACCEADSKKQAEETRKISTQAHQTHTLTPVTTTRLAATKTSRRAGEEKKAGTDQVIVFLGVLIGLIVAAFFFARWLEARRTDPPRDTDAGSPVAPPLTVDKPIPAVLTGDAVGEPAPAPALSPDDPARDGDVPVGSVRLVIRGQSWLTVRDAGGQLLYEGMAESPSRLDFDAAAGLSVKAGRPDLVFWLMPGEELQVLGGIDDIEWITLAKAQPVQPAQPANVDQPAAADMQELQQAQEPLPPLLPQEGPDPEPADPLAPNA